MHNSMMKPRATMLMIAASTSLLMLLMMMTAIVVEGGGVDVDGIGINWGRQTSQKLLPSMVVDMCLANGIKKVKLFSMNEGVLSAFYRSKIQVMVTNPNNEMHYLATNESARAWVADNITYPYKHKDLDIRYIGLGVEPLSFMELKRDPTLKLNLPKYFKNLQTALDEAGFRDIIKLTIPHGTDILKPFKKPSEADFRDDIKGLMIEILKHLDAHDTPLMVNIFPHIHCIEDSMPIEFGFFDGQHNISIVDGPYSYDNMFDIKYDAFLWALRKNGFGQMNVSVGQVGWPTDGHKDATSINARRFFNGFLKKLATKSGTPLQRGVRFEAYLYVLTDENQRSFARGPFERHYGIYDRDGQPKYPLDFSLQGRDILPEAAVGASYLPKRWCILDSDPALSNESLVKEQYEWACNRSDCTSLANGASCSYLSYYDKVSFAFNSYFQENNQDIRRDACNFKGLGKVTGERPEIGGKCIFRVNILSTLFLNSLSTAEMALTLGTARSFAGDRRCLETPLFIVLPLLWLLFLRVL